MISTEELRNRMKVSIQRSRIFDWPSQMQMLHC